jgi:hypothetical protein
VDSVVETMPAEGDEGAIADSWPQGQACNLDEYLTNHVRSTGVTQEVKDKVSEIQKRLHAYFQLKNSYVCGGKTRYQRGGAPHEY